MGQQLPGYPEGGILPLAFVADAAFPLREDLLQPYAALWQGNMDEPEKMFNYRLSRACRVVQKCIWHPIPVLQNVPPYPGHDPWAYSSCCSSKHCPA